MAMPMTPLLRRVRPARLQRHAPHALRARAASSAADLQADWDWAARPDNFGERDWRQGSSLAARLEDATSHDGGLVREAIAALAPFVTEARRATFERVLSQRSQSCRVLFERPSNPNNVWACLRTIDSFGLQHVDVCGGIQPGARRR